MKTTIPFASTLQHCTKHRRRFGWSLILFPILILKIPERETEWEWEWVLRPLPSLYNLIYSVIISGENHYSIQAYYSYNLIHLSAPPRSIEPLVSPQKNQLIWAMKLRICSLTSKSWRCTEKLSSFMLSAKASREIRPLKGMWRINYRGLPTALC